MPQTLPTRTSSDPAFSLSALLESYRPYDEIEAAILTQMRQFLAHTDNAYDRGNLTAHVVADAWIVNPARTHVVLVEHGVNKDWCAPGGHCDGDPDVMGAALREAEEEAGLTGLTPLLGGGIFDLNAGAVPLRHKNHGIEPAHIHFDVCFAFEAPENAALRISDESLSLGWVALSDIPTLNYNQSHQRRVEKMMKGML
jgi:8-oxo-dGTP pyrophosphatase MutT (NUDIX family)